MEQALHPSLILPPRIAGFAAVYGVPSKVARLERGGRRLPYSFAAGAFDSVLRSRPHVVALIEHDDRADAMGDTRRGTLTLTADDAGLLVEVTPPATMPGRALAEAVADGRLGEMSLCCRWLFADERIEGGLVVVTRVATLSEVTFTRESLFGTVAQLAEPDKAHHFGAAHEQKARRDYIAARRYKAPPRVEVLY